MSIKFIYSRNITTPTEQDKKLGRTFSVSCKGGVTIGYTFDEDTRKIRLAVARCSDSDNFNRKVARDIVMGRLLTKRKGRATTIDLGSVNIQTPQQIQDTVWGWLENQERLWDVAMESYKIH